MKVIFLDIDGVLNCQNYFIKNHKNILNFWNKNKANSDVDMNLEIKMMEIDKEKLEILKSIIDDTQSKIVIISSWKSLKVYPHVVNRLIEIGLPIIDRTIDSGEKRGNGIYNYLMDHDVSDFVILDDDIFDDYDNILLEKLIKTNFYGDGLTLEHANMVRKRLNK